MMRSSVPTRGRHRRAGLAVAVVLAATLAACGQKGPLRMPAGPHAGTAGAPGATPTANPPTAASAPAR